MNSVQDNQSFVSNINFHEERSLYCAHEMR